MKGESEIEKVQQQTLRLTERTVIRRAKKLIEQGVLDAASINDDGTDDNGVQLFEGTRRRVALDLRQTARNKKAYLEFALRRIEGAEKIEAAREQAPKYQLNNCVVINVTPREYPEQEVGVIDVTAEPTK
jgi:hypothetical protein